MKCKNCGANYSSRELFCPYCNTPNPVGRLQKMQRERAQADYETASTETVRQLRLQMCNRILNRTLLVEAILFGLFIVGLIATFYLHDLFLNTKKKMYQEDMQTHMEELYTQEHFSELYQYMNKYELVGPENYEYSQIALLYCKYDDFQLSRMEYFYEQDNLNPYTADSLVRNLHNLLNTSWSPVYADPTERNAAYYEQYAWEAEVFARSVLGFQDEQIEILKQDFLYMEEQEQLIALMMEGKNSDAP